MGQWKFLLADSDNMEVVADITHLARNKALTLSHNRSGNCTFQLPLTVDILNHTKTNNKCVICMKNNVVVWSGPIWTRSIDLDQQKVDISSVGWFELLMSRFLWTGTIPDYSAGQPDGTIAALLLKNANADTYPTYIAMDTYSTDNVRKIKYEIFQSIGEEIINLSDMEAGFDIYMDPVTRELTLKSSSDYEERTEIPFGMNHGVNNVSNIIIEENGGEMRNRISVVGGDNTVWTYNDTTSQALNGIMHEIVQVTETTDSDVLQAIANSYGAIKSNGLISYDISLKPQGESNPYELFEDYNIGDRIYVTAQKQIEGETLVFTQEPRIFGATINIDENGVERVSSLQTTFSGS